MAFTGIWESWLARALVFAEQDVLTLSVATTGDDTPSDNRPLRLQGGDYSAYPFLTIQAAIDAAGHRSKPTYINIGAGTFSAFELKGIVSADIYKFTGTMGTPVGPFTINTWDADTRRATFLGVTWTPGEYAGYVVEVLSGTGAGSKRIIYNNGADWIDLAAIGVGVGSVLQFIPIATIVNGYKTLHNDSTDFVYTAGVFESVGLFVFWNIWFDNDTAVSSFATDNSAGAHLAFLQCRIGEGNDWPVMYINHVGSIVMKRCFLWGWSDYTHVKSFHTFDYREEVLEGDEYWYDIACEEGAIWWQYFDKGTIYYYRGYYEIGFADGKYAYTYGSYIEDDDIRFQRIDYARLNNSTCNRLNASYITRELDVYECNGTAIYGHIINSVEHALLSSINSTGAGIQISNCNIVSFQSSTIFDTATFTNVNEVYLNSDTVKYYIFKDCKRVWSGGYVRSTDTLLHSTWENVRYADVAHARTNPVGLTPNIELKSSYNTETIPLSDFIGGLTVSLIENWTTVYLNRQLI